VIGRSNEVGNVGREGRVGEIALAGAKAGEIEPQHRDAACCQCCRNSFRRQHILAAGEAMREQRIASWFTLGHIERGRELMAALAGELETFNRHRRSPSFLMSWHQSSE